MKILHLDTNHPLLWDMLEQAGFENHADYTSDLPTVLEKLHQYDGLVIRSRFKIDAHVLSFAKNLKCIGRVGAGLENIDTQEALRLGIQTVAAPEGNATAVGEHALGMLLALFNKMVAADASVRQGFWLREQHRGVELSGKTVAIIGYGHMGTSFAKKLSGFDCKVMCVDILDNKSDVYAEQVSWESVFEQADVVSLHLPQTPETIGIVNKSLISKFHKPFWLVNTARGKHVVTQDVVLGLQNGRILGAALDVLEFEKLSFENLSASDLGETWQYLTQAQNVILSPHVAGWTIESHEKLARVIAQKMIRVLKNY